MENNLYNIIIMTVSNFFLSNLRKIKNPTNSNVKNHFFKIMQQEQFRKMNNAKQSLVKIDELQRKLPNLVNSHEEFAGVSDEDKDNIRKFVFGLLSVLHIDILKDATVKETNFLSILDELIKYEPST